MRLLQSSKWLVVTFLNKFNTIRADTISISIVGINPKDREKELD